ncbi:MAG: hypothetical protein GYB31_12675 [Bacteroidetes bacterium]|nr:hypothetical protein [Bacteroidota bacterium]
MSNHLSTIRTIFIVQLLILATMAGLFIVGALSTRFEVKSFFFCLLFGTLGASVSLLRRVQADKAAGKRTRLPLLETLMPMLYGTVLAGVVYLLFMSGILSGQEGDGLLTTNLFPDFTKLTDAEKELPLLEQFTIIQPLGIKNTGKLFVWCFIGGYSERFVIGLIDQLEQKGSGS